MTYEYLFNNIKNGDLIGFHFKSWHYFLGVFIGKVTGNTGNNLKIPGLGHIGIILDVDRSNDLITFKFCEYLFNEGKSIKFFCIKKEKANYLISDYFCRKDVDLYYTLIKNELNTKENINALDFWKNNNKKYDIIEAATSPNWAEKILKFFGLKKNTKEKKINNIIYLK